MLAFALASAWQLTPPAAEPVDAACTTASCATLEIVFGNGAGTGLVTTFPFGMDCEWTGSTRTGTCVAQFDVGGGLDVVLYLDPGAHSYACYGQTCAGLEARLERTVRLNPGDNIDVYPVFNIGVKATVQMRMAGSGDGRVTSTPTGLNCRWLDGVKSGTCETDFYFYPAQTYSVQLHRTPDAGSFACSQAPPNCGAPGEVYTATLGVSPDYVSAPPATFYEAKPVVVTITGSGSVVSSPAGISCPTTCSAWLPPNYSANPPNYTTLTASPAAGWFVKDWSGVCDGTSGLTCQVFNDVAGSTAGVVFAQTATPQPPRTPKPSSTPKPSPQGTSTAAPASGAPASGAPSAGPSATLGPPLPSGSAEPPGSPGATDPSPSIPGPAGGGRFHASTAAPDPVVVPGPAGGPDLLVVGLLGVVAALIVAIGYLLGRRRTPTRPRA